MRQLVYLLGIATVISIGCKREPSISNQTFHLVDPANHKNIKSEVTCQFSDKKVEIFTFKNNSKNIADVEVGVYSMDNGILTFPRGRFDIKKIGARYQLSAQGKLKYLLLTDAEFSRLMKALELNEGNNSEVLSESI